jgi:hypothetical protein
MRDAGVGRVLVASLHQGIADLRPMRLSFYEHWLTGEGLREGTIGMAPLMAVLSFLRQEGDLYQAVTTRAGEYAAEWTVLAMTQTERAFVNAMPERLRQRLVLRVACRIVRSSYSGSRAVSRLQTDTADVVVDASIFCTVREPVPLPLCGFYASALTRLFTLFDLTGRAEVVGCRGTTGGSSCLLKVALAGDDAASARDDRASETVVAPTT